MKRLILFCGFTLSLTVLCAQVKVSGLLCENLENPIGIDVNQPRFTWLLTGDRRNIHQAAYELAVNDAFSNEAVWKSGKVNTDSSVQVAYRGTALQTGHRYTWRVRVWDDRGKLSSWSPVASFQMALLDPGQWKAKWIEAGAGLSQDPVTRPAVYFRKEFTSKKIRSATAYITAHGMYEAMINGEKIGDACLAPGWTSYNKRLQYQVYDITPLVKEGINAIGIITGNGWYRGYLAWDGNKNVWGSKLGVFCQIDIRYADGSAGTVVSDQTWKCSTGSITACEIYDGETIDARLDQPGWDRPHFHADEWKEVAEAGYDLANLVATQNEPVKKHETFKPVRIFTTPAGEQVLDFGQNLVGWVIVKARGKAGDTIDITHAEVLDKHGNFYTDNLRAAKAEGRYILKGGGEESFEPHFTFYGFRYIRVKGYPGTLKPEDFQAVALYSDMQSTGSFSTSNPMINQLQHNIEWGQKGNFLDVPTDCPQRDERLGWTGDAQVFSRTASFNMNVNNFFAKWLKDVAADQETDGSVPFVIPNVLGHGAGGSTGWADVSTIIPWNMYLAYGDRRILETQYPSMKAWVDYMHTKSKNDLWNTGFHFGDWLFYRPFDDNDGRSAVTDKYLIAQCFYAHSTQLLINAATVLGKKDDASRYKELLDRIKSAFMKEYVTPNGRLVSGTQTAYVLALNFDMLPEPARPQAAERLVDNVKSYDDHLTTGFLGTPYLCHVLSRFGYDSVAYALLLQDTYPSWLYPVKMGATTIWERWDGIRPDSTFEVPSMNSFNHYSYGAIGDWMYRVMAGIDTYADAPGYRHIRIQPHPGGGFDSARASLRTYYGLVSSSWKFDGHHLSMDVTIPANTTATIYVPAVDETSVKESGRTLAEINELSKKPREGKYVVIDAGSGTYHFTAD